MTASALHCTLHFTLHRVQRNSSLYTAHGGPVYPNTLHCNVRLRAGGRQSAPFIQQRVRVRSSRQFFVNVYKMNYFFDWQPDYIRNIPLQYWIPIICLCVTLACNYVYRSRIAAIVLNFFLAMSISAMACASLHIHGQRNSTVLKGYPGDSLITKAHLIEMALVPPIIFNCAFDLDINDLRKFFGQIIILVGPCFVFSSLFYGCLMLIYWDRTLHVASPLLHVFPMAGYLTAVDPITVGAMVDDLSLSHQLTTLLKFESLLCQATAGIFEDFVQFAHNVSEPKHLIMNIAGDIGSVALGHVYGRATASILTNILYVDHIAEGGLRFVMIYVSYATGVFLGSSGTLCLVVFAITFNSHRGSIAQRAYEDTKSVWATFAFNAHGILTGLVGVTAGESLAGDLYSYQAVILFLLGLFSRFLSLLIFTPVLRLAGSFELEYMAMLVAAGIHGFLSIVMMLKPTHLPKHGADMIRNKHGAISDMIVIVVLSQLFQGLVLRRVARWLGLQLQLRLQPEQLRSWRNRTNARVRKSANKRKQLMEKEEIAWGLIEKELDFDCSKELDDAKPDQIPKDCTKKKADNRKRKKSRDLTAEVEARERIQHCYEAQVRQLWQTHGRTTSVASRVLENSIRDAAINRRALNIDRLFTNLQPRPFSRRLAARGRKIMKKLNAERFLNYFAIYESLWQWRLFVCLANTISSAYLVHLSLKAELTSSNLFFGALVAFLMTIEQLMRLFRMVRKFDSSSPSKPIVKEVWFWFEMVLLMMQLMVDVVHYVIIANCVEREFEIVDLTSKGFCRRAGIAMTVSVALPFIQIPLVIGLLFRLALSEIKIFVEYRDEQTFEAISGLLTATDTVMRLLDGNKLVQSSDLKKQLGEELAVTKKELENKLIELLNRQGGAKTLANIKTRQATRDVLVEVTGLLLEGKRCGALRDFEHICMEDNLNEMRANLESMPEQKPPPDEDLYANPQSTSEMGAEILASQLRQMEWMRAASSYEEMDKTINQLAANGKIEKFKKQKKIVADTDLAEVKGIFILLNGFCRGISYDPARDTYSRQRLIYPGTLFGENGFLRHPYTETVVAVSPKVLTFWVSAKSINRMPVKIRQAFMKQYVAKACIDYLRHSDRLCSWPDELLHLYVRRMLKIARHGEVVPEDQRSLHLFMGTLVDAEGKSFEGTPYRPMKLDEGQYTSPLKAGGLEGKDSPVYYLVNRYEHSTPEVMERSDVDEADDSLILADLECEISNLSLPSLDSNPNGGGSPCKFKPLYTKFKKNAQ